MRETALLPYVLDIWQEVVQSLSRARRILIGFDFDGTLAPIVQDPDQACMPHEIRSALERLLSSDGVYVAVLSGRSLDDLRERVNLNDVILAGDHGLRIRFPDGEEYKPLPREINVELAVLRERLEAASFALTGIYVEPKEYSLTVHYRAAPPGTGSRLEEILSASIEGTPFRLRAGRMCWEINPGVNWNKGSAYEWIRRHCLGDINPAFELYVGDDRTDEDVFPRLQDRGFPILVLSGEKSGSTAARFCINAQEEVGILVEKIAKQLKKRPSTYWE